MIVALYQGTTSVVQNSDKNITALVAAHSLQGLKPYSFEADCGTAEAVPLYKAIAEADL